MGGACNDRGEKWNEYNVLVGKTIISKYITRRLRCRWEEYIKVEIQETGVGGFFWLRIGTSRGFL
jgi:hypothetical protein